MGFEQLFLALTLEFINANFQYLNLFFNNFIQVYSTLFLLLTPTHFIPTNPFIPPFLFKGLLYTFVHFWFVLGQTLWF